MTNFVNAKHAIKSISEITVFHIAITGHDEKTGATYFSIHERYPTAHLINKPYRQGIIRHIGALMFVFYDYEPDRNEWIYFFVAKQIMAEGGLNKS